MVDTIKFSQMNPGGDLANGEKTPGLLGGENVLFNNPWTFLPPGTTAARPAPSAAINYRLRFNTDDQLYEYYDAVLGAWTQLQESAFTQGPFVIYEADPSIPDAQNLGALATGILKQTVTTGVATLDIAVNGVDYYGPGFTGYFEFPAGVKDINGNIVCEFKWDAADATEWIQIFNGKNGDPAAIAVDGIAADVQLDFYSKGQGQIAFNSEAVTNQYSFFSGPNYQHQTVFYMPTTVATRTATWQDSDGTVAWLTDIPAGSPSALTRTNDTNVTVTLGGTPATALLQAVSLTLGWTGTLAPARGGLGVGTVPVAGQIPIGNSGGTYTIAAITSGTNILVGNGDGAITIGLTGVIAPTLGGTGVNNGTNTLTLAGTLATSGAFASTFTMTGATNVTFPTSGTLATTGQLPTPAALTKTDDTNVTITLGGSPATALLQATSLTMGWTGTLSGTRGGTGVNNGASTFTMGGSVAFSGAFTFTGTLTGNTSVTFPTSGTLATTASASGIVNSGSINQMAWYAANGTTLSGLSTANNGILVTSAGGVPSIGNTVGAGLTMPSITFNSTSGIIGTTTNNNAAALSVGELVSNVVADSTTSLTSNTNADTTSISLTAGDWDVWGNVAFTGAAGTGVIINLGWISTSSATLPASNLYSSFFVSTAGAILPYSIAPIAFTVPAQRLSLSATTTVYLSVRSAFITSTSTAGGAIYARRRR